jgi:hypothetical protein
MEAPSGVPSAHNSSETTNVAVQGMDDLTDGQQLCLKWAWKHDWDRVKGYAKEHGPEVLLGAYTELVDEKWGVVSVLTDASYDQNAEMAKLTLEAGFDNKEVMYMAAGMSMRNSDNATILRLLLEHGLDPNMDLHFEGLVEYGSNLLMSAAEEGHIDHAIALLDHGANVNKTVVHPDGHIFSPLTSAMSYGAYDMCRLFLARGSILTTNDVNLALHLCLGACKGEHPILSRDVAIKMFTTFIHLGKPDSDVVRDKFDSFASYHSDPIITNITKQYLQGRPFCCYVCEALTAKEVGRDKLLMCPCRNVAYCSRDCQVKHWKKHKVLCTGPLNEKGESEAMVKKRSKTGKGAAAGGTDVGVAEGAVAGVAEGAAASGRKGKKGKKGRGKKK